MTEMGQSANLKPNLGWQHQSYCNLPNYSPSCDLRCTTMHNNEPPLAILLVNLPDNSPNTYHTIFDDKILRLMF